MERIPTKIEDEIKQSIQEKFETIYGSIKDYAKFQHTQEEILNTVARFMKAFKIDERVFDDELSGVTKQTMLLAIADRYLTVNNNPEHTKIEKEKTFLLLANGLHNDWKFSIEQTGLKHFSQRIQSKAEKSHKREINFVYIDNPKLEKSEIQNSYKELEEYQELHTDPTATEKLTKRINIKNTNNNPLEAVRERLYITPETEKLFGVIVLNVTTNELSRTTNKIYKMQEGCGWNAYCCSINGVTNIVFGSDWETELGKNILEHEYTHTQCPNNKFGSNNIFGRGLKEAITEGYTTTPESYKDQRQIWNLIKNSIPELGYVELDLSKNGLTKDFAKFHNLIIQKYGVDTWLSIITLTAFNDGVFYKGESFFENANTLKLKILREYTNITSNLH